MYRSSLFLAAALVGMNVATMQPIVLATSAVEVGQFAKAITLEIKVVGTTRVGSGILLQSQGDVYTVLTAGHVLENGSEFTLKTSDGQVHRSLPASVKLAGSAVDLGVLKFKSTNKYALAKIGKSSSLRELSPIYVAGFPESTYAIESGTLNVTRGEVIGNATKGNAKGYSLIYSNTTFRGMSGGPVLNEAGELVAIHGQGDREGRTGEGVKTGRNLGIVIERLGAVAVGLGVTLAPQVSTLPQNPQLNAADYFLRGLSKDNSGDFRGAIADYSQAIILNPKDVDAYNNRGILKNVNLNDVPGALADYDQAVVLNPNYALVYYNRGLLKYTKLADVQGALSDYNRAILLNPREAFVFNDRGSLRANEINDLRGALADYNQAIALNPKYADVYYNRANLKKDKLNDLQGALTDYNRAITLNPRDAKFYNNRGLLKKTKLNDPAGALADYNQAIILNPRIVSAYYNRANLKKDQLGDAQGALSDYTLAISLNPKLAAAYYNRALLKKDLLQDRAGAIRDFRQAAKLYREQGDTVNTQRAIENLQELGATE
jgi:tetratricopeptide (TPR) repeat protein